MDIEQVTGEQVEAWPNLKERTDLDTLYRDGGFGSPAVDKILETNQVEQIQTAIRGRIPISEKLNLSDFTIKRAENKKPTKITCPQGQMVVVHCSSQKKAYEAHFEDKVCQTCPLLPKCPVQRGKRDLRFHLKAFKKSIVWVGVKPLHLWLRVDIRRGAFLLSTCEIFIYFQICSSKPCRNTSPV